MGVNRNSPAFPGGGCSLGVAGSDGRPPSIGRITAALFQNGLPTWRRLGGREVWVQLGPPPACCGVPGGGGVLRCHGGAPWRGGRCGLSPQPRFHPEDIACLPRLCRCWCFLATSYWCTSSSTDGGSVGFKLSLVRPPSPFVRCPIPFLPLRLSSQDTLSDALRSTPAVSSPFPPIYCGYLPTPR